MKGSVRKRGQKWYYYFDIATQDGKRKRIERVGGTTKKEADKALREALQQYENTDNFREASELSYSDFLEYWYENFVLINCKYNTRMSYRLLIDKHIKPNLGKYRLKTINPTSLQELLNKKYLSGYSKNYISNMFGVLSGSLKYAVHPCMYLKENPMQHVNMPKMEHSNPDKLKVITVNEFITITERFPFRSSFYIPLQIGFNTGMRSGEVCALRWDDIDLDLGVISVRHTLIERGKGVYVLGTPKTASSIRDIRIGESLIKNLQKQKKAQQENKLLYGSHYTDSQYVCTKENGEHVTTGSLRYLNRVVNFELGIIFNFHSLRHTHATLLLESGANIKHIQKRLGHSRLATTMDTYSHITDKMITDTVNIFEQIANLPPT